MNFSIKVRIIQRATHCSSSPPTLMSTFLLLASDIKRFTASSSSATFLLFYSRLRVSSFSSRASASRFLHGSSATITKLHLRLQASAHYSVSPFLRSSHLIIFDGLSTSFPFSRKLLFMSFHLFMSISLYDHSV